MKNIILFAGLPGVGKDTAVEYFRELKPEFDILNYSQDILKPIIENPKIIDSFISNNNFKKMDELISSVQFLIEIKKDRDLYISVAQTLNRYISEQTEGKFNHFCYLGKKFYDKLENIIIPSFREQEEIEVFNNLYNNSNIYPILITAPYNFRIETMHTNRNISYIQLLEEDKIEKETTYDKQVKEVDFKKKIRNMYNDTFKITIENLIVDLNL